VTAAAAVLLAVAKELSEQAKSGLPSIRDGERVRREWYESGKVYRETTLNGENYISLYDFGQRESRLSAARVTE
jgi:hypothetical protein